MFGFTPTTHALKCHPQPFQATALGEKKFEFRRDDRSYRLGDLLLLKEWDPRTEQYSGDSIIRRVTYILSGPNFGVPEGFVVMSLGMP